MYQKTWRAIIHYGHYGNSKVRFAFVDDEEKNFLDRAIVEEIPVKIEYVDGSEITVNSGFIQEIEFEPISKSINETSSEWSTTTKKVYFLK